MVQVLLDASANIEAKDSNDRSPLHYAARSNENPAVIQALLDAGANIDARNSDGDTPLAVALEQENSAAAQVLQDNGASQ